MRSHGNVLDPRHQSCVFPTLVMECRPRRGEEYQFCEASSTSGMVKSNEINIHIISSLYTWNLMGIYLNDQILNKRIVSLINIASTVNLSKGQKHHRRFKRVKFIQYYEYDILPANRVSTLSHGTNQWNCAGQALPHYSTNLGDLDSNGFLHNLY